MRNYQNLISQIANRYNPDNLYEARTKASSEMASSYSDITKYIRYAMMEVDGIYTQKTLEAGDNAKGHLKNSLKSGIEFAYQGSVMTQTHIRGASDIDLLVFAQEFNGTDLIKVRGIINSATSSVDSSTFIKLRNWHDNFSTYQGDWRLDLKNLRRNCENTLNRAYSQCDISKPKSIKIRNLHLNRDVDVVVCNRFDSIEYISGKGEEYRGVEIYDKHRDIRLDPDYPFLSIKRINDRSNFTGGRLKRMIRFLKNVRTDADNEIKLTSFDINAICYDISTWEYKDLHYIDLVSILYEKLSNLCEYTDNADNLTSVAGNEYIFRNNFEKVQALRLLKDEVQNIKNSLF